MKIYEKMLINLCKQIHNLHILTLCVILSIVRIGMKIRNVETVIQSKSEREEQILLLIHVCGA